jgi:HEAT repeat protein
MAGEQDIRYAASDREAAPVESSSVETVERDRAVMVLLRQLSSGLSSYRLFPGDLEQPTFVQAVERIQDATEKALVWGPFDAEINGNRFITSSGPVPSDDRIERLALAFYQHGAERLLVQAVPDARALGALYGALSRPAHEGGGPSGIGSALRVAAVQSIAVREVAPQSAERDAVNPGTTSEQHTVWERLGEPEKIAQEMVQAAGSYSPAEAAQAIFARLRHIVSLMPERQVRGVQLYGRLHEVIARLPQTLRRELMAILLGRITNDPLAERLIGTMTDAELTRVLVDQGEDGRSDPVDMARRLVSLRVRRDDLVDLTAALLQGQVEGRTIMTPLDRAGIEPAAEEASPVARTVSNLLARGLVSAKQEDVRAMREAFPETADDRIQVAIDALYDYLRIESEPDRLVEVLGVWSKEAVATLRRHDEEYLTHLLEAIEGVQEEDDVPVDKRTMVETSVRQVLSPEVLADLVSVTKGDEDPESIIRMLDLFGDTGVDCLMEDLAQERDRGRRALLLGALAQVARGRYYRVAKWLSDSRWYVARNAITVLYRSGREEVLPLLIEATRHREPAVRREAARGLVEMTGMNALPQLMALAGDTDQTVRATVIAALGAMVRPGACEALAKLAQVLKDPADRRRAIDALARHGAPEATGVLESLASSKSPSRLPWSLRRYARDLAKKRREGKR